MMVMRPEMALKSPASSRGSSPGRGNSMSRSRGSSPGKNPSGNAGRQTRIRGSSPAGSDRFTGNSTLPRSRGSENGSFDRLDQSVEGPIRTHAGAMVEDNINVVVRVRPLSKKELKCGDDSVVQFPGNGQLLLDGEGGGAANQKRRVFSYNVVFETGASQEDVLQFSGIKRLIEMAVEGFSTTAFCYGQTGSGKTHTLTGPPSLFGSKNPDPYSEYHGLVFRSFMYLFKLLQERSDFHFVLKASFLEIYNEKVIDLLNPGSVRKPLAVRWSKKSRGFFVENLFTVDCEELDDLLAVLEEGMRNRSVGRHNMNEYSSRSHTILTVHITSEQQMGEDGVFISKQGKINFVDLAGSEMTKKTQSEGKTLEEANNINKSLMVLGYCIASLSDQKKKGGHIPYRDSKLTKLLADSLAGNGVTLMIACISPARSNVTETINTLRYAARAKKIRTKPIVVMDPREALILSLKREVNALQNENEHLRSALHITAEPGVDQAGRPANNMANLGRLALTTPAAVALDKLTELEGPELTDLVRHYLTENEALRRENSELFTTRELLIRDQDLVCRENERLLKKLEDVNSVCCRSPIIPARPTYSAEMLNMSMADTDAFSSTNVWTNPLNGSVNGSVNGGINGGGAHHTSSGSSLTGPRFKQEIMDGRMSVKPPHRIPDSIQKEMDKRNIGSSLNNIADTYRERSHRRNNSWDNGKAAPGSAGSGSADSTSSRRNAKLKEVPDATSGRRTPSLRRTSTAPSGDFASILSASKNMARRTSSLHASFERDNTLVLPDRRDVTRSLAERDLLHSPGSGFRPPSSVSESFESTMSIEDLYRGSGDEERLSGTPKSLSPLTTKAGPPPPNSLDIAAAPLPPIAPATESPTKRTARAIIQSLKTALFPSRNRELVIAPVVKEIVAPIVAPVEEYIPLSAGKDSDLKHKPTFESNFFGEIPKQNNFANHSRKNSRSKEEVFGSIVSLQEEIK